MCDHRLFLLKTLKYIVLLKKKMQVTDPLKKQQHEVQITIEILRIGEIDTMNEKYNAELRLDAKWVDLNDANIEKYDPAVYWNPKLFIENALSIANEKVIHRIEGKSIRETRFIKGTFWERLEIHNVNLKKILDITFL